MKNTIALIALVLFAKVAVAETRWNLAAEQPESNYMTQIAQEFAKEVAAASNGALSIKIHSNGVLFKRPEVRRAVQTGQVQMADVVMSILGNEDPAFEIDTIPMLARSFDEAHALWSASKPAVSEKLARHGVRVLYAVPWPPQSFFTKNEVQQTSDLKGIRFRSYSPALSRMIELMGGSPTVVSPGEIPQAFSTGVISAMITSPITGVDSQAWEYSKYYYDVKAFIPKNFMLVNERAFRELPEAVQKAVLDAAGKAEKKGWKIAQELTDKNVELLRNNGMVVAPVPSSLDADLKKIGHVMKGEWAQRAGATGAKILADYGK